MAILIVQSIVFAIALFYTFRMIDNWSIAASGKMANRTLPTTPNAIAAAAWATYYFSVFF
jgi:hypothetical protein